MANERKYSKAFLDEGWNDFGRHTGLNKKDWYNDNAYEYICNDMEDNDSFKKYPNLLKEQARKYYSAYAQDLDDYSDDFVKGHTKKVVRNFDSKLTPELYRKYERLSKINNDIGDIRKSKEYKIGKLKRKARNALIGSGVGAISAYCGRIHPLIGAATGATVMSVKDLSDLTKRNIEEKARVKRVKRIYPNYDKELNELNNELSKKLIDKTGGENMSYYKEQIEKYAEEIDDEINDYFRRRAESIAEERERAIILLNNDMWLQSLPRNAQDKIRANIMENVNDSLNRGVSAEKSVERALDYTRSLVKNDTIREFNRLSNVRNKIENSDIYRDTYKKNKGTRIKSTLKGTGAGSLIGGTLGYAAGRGAGGVAGGVLGGILGTGVGLDAGREKSHNRAFGVARDKIYPTYHKDMSNAKNKLFKDLYRSWEED